MPAAGTQDGRAAPAVIARPGGGRGPMAAV